MKEKCFLGEKRKEKKKRISKLSNILKIFDTYFADTNKILEVYNPVFTKNESSGKL